MTARGQGEAGRARPAPGETPQRGQRPQKSPRPSKVTARVLATAVVYRGGQRHEPGHLVELERKDFDELCADGLVVIEGAKE